MSRGFFTTQWRNLYRRATRLEQASQWLQRNTDTGSLPETTSNDEIMEARHPSGIGMMEDATTRFMSKIIRILWSNLSQLCTEHLHFIHERETRLYHHIKTQEIRQQIRHLYALRDKTLAAHRDRYFVEDLEHYLETTSMNHMTKYINRYRPAILNSIRQATRIATNALQLTAFQGFTRQTDPTTQPVHSAMEEPATAPKTHKDRGCWASKDHKLLLIKTPPPSSLPHLN